MTTKRRAHAVFIATFLIGLSILFYTNAWWPHIFLVICAATVARQFFRGRTYDMLLSTVIFGGLFLTFYLSINWSIVMPVILFTAGITILYREFFVEKKRVAKELLEDVNKEVDEDRGKTP